MRNIIKRFTLTALALIGLSTLAMANTIDYELWIGATQVTSLNRNDVTGDGTVSYSPNTQTLTLNKANITANGNLFYGIENTGIDGLTIEVNDDCTITAQDCAIMLKGGTTTITGPGKLTLVSTYEEGIHLDADNTLNLQHADIDVKGEYAISGVSQAYNCIVNVNFSTLVANTFNVYDEHLTISGLTDFNLVNCVYDDKYFGFYYDYGYVCYMNEEYYGKVSISPRVAVNATNFPDDNFRNYVGKKFDTDTDGYLSVTELNNVSELNVFSDGIASLQGVEFFTKLEILNCFQNKLTALDVSKNTQLKSLVCWGNQLTALDVSKNTQLTTLDFRSNQLTTLDVTKNTMLVIFWCEGNQLTALDVTKNTQLVDLDCSFNQLTALDVTKNTQLVDLDCYYNQLTALNMSNNTQLKVFYCNNNKLTDLDVTNNTMLEDFMCNGNQLTSLDVSKNTMLRKLYCHQNPLNALDVTKNTMLRTLNCVVNQLTALDITKNTQLIELYCYNNQLTALDVSKNTELEVLKCEDNKLTALDLSKNTQMRSLRVYHNLIEGQAMDNLISSLPTRPDNDGSLRATGGSDDEDEQNTLTEAQQAAALEKGWKATEVREIQYALWVGNYPVKSANLNDITGNGTTSYNPTTKTLTLNKTNFSTPSAGEYGIRNGGIDGLTIEVEGSCYFDTYSTALLLQGGTTTVTGTGKLILNSAEEEGIKLEANTTLTLKDTYVDVTGWNPIMGEGIDSNSVLNVINSKLIAKPTNGYNQEYTISELSDFTLTDSYFDDPGVSGYSTPGYFFFDPIYGCVMYGNDWYCYRINISPVYDNTPTSISQPQATEPSTSDDTYYNLQGQRVDHPTKGIYVRNGRKVIVK